uniref:RNase NYN domain-containing protein n=1 Tax=Spongospora subterranea TaxID=70186 RepID=A0A0H5R6K4_9EUKA|eukprot:CRZ09760.1 hypothetical protein [Spongospora subterranea]
MTSERDILREAINHERNGDLDTSTALFQRLLINHSAWALDKKVDTRLLTMWRKAVEHNTGLHEAAKMVQRQVYVQANDVRIKSLAISSLGDLERYSGRIDQAGIHYQQAISICPSMGKAYNQLAVIHGASCEANSQLMAVHGYLRALWAERPFLPARENLLHTFTDNTSCLARPQTTLVDRWNRLIIRIAELAFLETNDDAVTGPYLTELNAISRSMALAQNDKSLPNLPHSLVILLGLAERNGIAWQALTIIFGWQMSSLALSTAPRVDLILAIFCIVACRRVESLNGSPLLMHLSRLVNSLALDGISDSSLAAKADPKSTTPSLDLFIAFAPIESIPGWSAVVDGLCRQPDFLHQSVKTLATLTLDFKATMNRFEIPESGPSPLVVLDVPNISMNHGRNRVFSCKGLALAIHFFKSRGFSVQAFVPEQCMDYEKVSNLKRLGRLEGWAAKASAMPDDIASLRLHYANGVVVATPQGDYDDSYTIEHSRRNDGIIISNDRFRDATQKIQDPVEVRVLTAWIRSNVCSFTFAGDQFIPNPDFAWPKAHESFVKLSG